MKRERVFILLCLIISLWFAVSTPIISYATGTKAASSVAETQEETEEEREAESGIGQRWKNFIDLAKDFFLGPSHDKREHIDEIKEIEPYELLGDISFPDDTGMKEAKDISASFYQLICAVSVLGLILSFIGAGLSIAINRARNKPEVEAAILTKIAVFVAICCVAGLWGLFVPILKLAADMGI